ncbi:MAG: stage II sporulation protein M [Stenotrophomonas sp.]|uniref:stage II sporulation protein M n=1 Tax=Stenotrophomonas sp. TaxID=69392 RepID=UPI0028A5F07D|nr:stage II sporulation protein M [Stenotrophomonas sp.]
MKQEQFVTRYQHEWLQFENWLQQRGEHARKSAPALSSDLPGDETIPQRYRRLCQQFALAQQRGYSPQLVEHLQQLMQRGHNLMYRTPRPRWQRAVEFLFADFPLAVRSQAAAMWVSCALFAVPLIGIFVLLQVKPEMVHLLLDQAQITQMEKMYAPAADDLGRSSGTDWAMFGHYIMNNISIGLRTFASGLLAGIGTILVLVFNGITIGAVAGHLQHAGFGPQFWRFVVGHAPFELTAIVIAGGAGLQLGLRLLAPGQQRRIDALVEGGRIGARLCLGVAFMLLVAAFIEAFWSSIAVVPMWGKLTVSIVLWLLVLGWLWRGGRGSSHAH